MTLSPTIDPLSPGEAIGPYVIGGLLHHTPLTLRYSLAQDARTLVEFAPSGHVARGPEGILPPVKAAMREVVEKAGDAFIAAEFNAAKKARCGDFDLDAEPITANSTSYYASSLPAGQFLTDLAARYRQGGPDELRQLLVGLCDQLKQANAAGMPHGAIAAERVFIPQRGAPKLVGFGHRPSADILGIELAAANELKGEAGDVYGLSELGYLLITGHAPTPYSQRAKALESGAKDPLVPPADYADAAAHGSVIRAISRGLSLSSKPSSKTLEDWAFTVEGRERLMSDGAPDTPAQQDALRPAKDETPPAPPPAPEQAASASAEASIPLRPIRPARGKTQSAAAKPSGLRNVVLLLAGLAVLSVGLLYANQAGLFTRDEQAQTLEPEQTATPTPSSDDERAWVNARTIDTLGSYTAYLSRFPDGFYADEARQRLDALDNEAWEAAIALNTLEGYRGYIEAFPLGVHVPEAQQLIDRIEAGIAAIAAADEKSWNEARQADTVAAYDGYLSAYPDGQFVDEAKQRRAARQEEAQDDQAFEAAENIGTIMAYQSYVNRFPKGRHIAKALSKLDRLTTRTGDVFKDCGQCPNMVVIGSGTFDMGAGEDDPLAKPSEKPQHKVTIPRAFALSQSEVTVGQWKACAGAGACRYEPKQGQNDGLPVVHISWDEAKTYVQWLATTTGKPYRLPSEAEWEYAARAGEAQIFAGGREGSVCRTANIAGAETQYPWRSTACDDGVATGVETVQRRQPNPFGLYDMIGNAAEWTQDCASLSYRDAPTAGEANERGMCSSRIARGGSWISGPRDFRLSARMARNKGDTDDTTGLRVALTLPK